jgi:hypothetical protein
MSSYLRVGPHKYTNGIALPIRNHITSHIPQPPKLNFAITNQTPPAVSVFSHRLFSPRRNSGGQIRLSPGSSCANASPLRCSWAAARRQATCGCSPSMHRHPEAATCASGHGKWPCLPMATRRRARRGSPRLRASCCSTGSRSAQRLVSWGPSLFVDTQRQALEQGSAIQGCQAGVGGSRAGFNGWRFIPFAACLHLR